MADWADDPGGAGAGVVTFDARYYKLSPPEKFDGLQQTPVAVDLHTAALLLVDVYGWGFTSDERGARSHPSFDQKAALPWDEVARRGIAPALEAARRVGLPVIYAQNSGPRIELNRSQLGKVLNRTLDCDLEDLYRERGVDPREYYVGEGDLLLETSRLLAAKEGDYFIRKHQYSGFRDSRLDALLRNLEIKTLFCAGFDAGACLKMTMMDAFELNYELILLRDATLAIEIPEDVERGYSFTERIIWWMEAHLCTSIRSADLVAALAPIPARSIRVKRGS